MFVNLEFEDREVQESIERLQRLLDEVGRETTRLRGLVGFYAEKHERNEETAASGN